MTLRREDQAAPEYLRKRNCPKPVCLLRPLSVRHRVCRGAGAGRLSAMKRRKSQMMKWKDGKLQQLRSVSVNLNDYQRGQGRGQGQGQEGEQGQWLGQGQGQG